MSSLADAWKMLAMSAVRLCVARLTPLVALAALSLIAGCTKPTPLYCNNTDVTCDPGYHCEISIHTCKPDNTAVDANDASAPGDAPADKTDGGTGGDHPSGTDGPRSDASDGSVDVFHGCVDNRGCPDSTKHVCQVDAGTCVGCLQNGDCTSAGARACDTTTNKCVECVVNGDCTDPTKPVCDHQACRGCKADSECTGTGPSVCMFHLDGHCATDSETVYVAPNNSSCSDTDVASGTSHKPFCHSQPAIDSTAAPAPVDAGTDNSDGGDSDGGAASAKTLVVMQGGTYSLSAWSFNDASRTLTVVGQLSALLSPGGATGIHISGGKLYIRNLRVSGGSGMDPAIVVDGGAELHLDRCTVDSNHGAGVQIDNAGFEITNSVIAGNGVGISTGPVLWSGVLLGAVPAGKPAVFQNNTVVSNSEPGVICTTGNSHDIVGSILFGNMPTNSAQSVGCNFVSCCTGDPALTSNYRLTATSPCKDQIPGNISTANISTAYDIDGDPRPFSTLSDCGADEYTGP